MNEELFGLLGGDPDAINQQAKMSGLLNFAANLLQASGPSRTPQSLGANIGAALPGYAQGYQSTIDSTLKNLAMRQKLSEEQRKQDALKQYRERIAGATTMQPTAQGVMDTQSNIDPMLLEGMSAQQVIAQAPRTQQFTDQSAADRATLDYLQQVDPVEYAKLITTAPKAAPGKVGEFMAALREGVIPQGTSLKDFVAMTSSPGTTVNVGGEASPFGKEAQKLQAQNFAEVSKSGIGARRSLNDINRLESLLNKSPGGMVAAGKVLAGNFGIKTEGLSDLQAAQALINRLVPQQRPPGSGTMSDRDLELFKASLPRIINQPGGNKIIIETMRQVNQYLVKEAEIANRVLNGKLTPEQGDIQIAALANPLEGFSGQSENVSSGNFPALSNDDQNLLQKYLNPRR